MAFSRKAFRTDLSALSAEVSTGTRQTDGKPYVAVRLWMNGKSTQTVLFADDRAAMIAIVNALGDTVEKWVEPTDYTTSVNEFFKAAAPAAAIVQPAQTAAAAPDLAAIMAEISALKAANAALAAAAPTANGRPATSAAPTAAAPAAASKTQVSLSRISRRK